jgi:glutathione S-transferase
VSYPFFWDQPGLARKCQELELAIPLADAVQGRFTTADVARALDTLRRRGTALRSALGRARAWEEAVVAKRPEVIRRIARLIA